MSSTPVIWPAPLASGPIDAVVAVPGSKSVTNRALLLAAIADGPSTISRPLVARDTQLMADALRALGAEITETSAGWQVQPRPLTGPASVDCGLAGTVMRFVPPVAALAQGNIFFDGDARARIRPMSAIIDALRQLGVLLDDEGRGSLPFTVLGKGNVKGGAVSIDASASSQFVSALLLAGCRYDEGVVIRHKGKSVPSLPHIAMSVQMLRDRGVQVDSDVSDLEQASWRVAPSSIRAIDCEVEPDLSNALPFIAAAMVTAGRVTIPGWPARSMQPGAQIPEILQQMGGEFSIDETGLHVQGPTRLQGIEIDLSAVGELAPVLAAIAALAATHSKFTGIAHLRGHETDRLQALATELNRAGGNVLELADGLTISPATLHGCQFETYDDHRMATAAAVLGLVVPDLEVVDVATTAKTLPGFTGMWRQMLETA